jgi:hypothetical protein
LDETQEALGRVRAAPRPGAAKSSFATALISFADGVEKSILKGSFFSFLGLAAPASAASAKKRLL